MDDDAMLTGDVVLGVAVAAAELSALDELDCFRDRRSVQPEKRIRARVGCSRSTREKVGRETTFLVFCCVGSFASDTCLNAT